MNRSRQMSGYTLIEMVLALAITSTLLVGMSASIVIASRTVSDGLDVVGLALRTADVLGEINSDLSMAEAFAERSDSAVTFCVPDRDGDGQSDVLRYWWTGSGDKRLMKQINSGPEIALAEDVRQFSLTYGVSTMAAKSPSDYDDDDSDRRWNGRRRRVGWGKFWDHRGHGWGHYDFMPGNGHGNGNGNGHGNGHNSGQGHWECGGGTSDDDIAPPGSAWREGWTGPGSDDDDSGNGNGNGNGGNGGNSSDDDDDDDDSSNNGKGNGKGGGKK